MAKKKKIRKTKRIGKTKKSKNTSASSVQRKIPLVLYVIGGIVVVCLAAVAAFLIYISFHQEPASLSVFPEQVKQGGTVLIRVENAPGQVTGSFGTAQDKQSLVFYRKGGSEEWIALLGIDVSHKPGSYNISVDASETESFTQAIKVESADFSTVPAAKAPNLADKGYTNKIAVENITENDSPALKKVLSKLTPEAYFTEPFSFPLNSMEISGYGFGRYISFAGSTLQHLGVDLRAAEGTEVYSVNGGKVAAMLNLSNGGKTIVIDHGLNIFSLYLHLDEFKVSEGETVKKGQLIGLSGDTGYSTAAHLHFSIKNSGSRVDPLAFIETTQNVKNDSFLASLREAFLNIIK